MTEEDILNIKADIAIARARADAAVDLCEALINALRDNNVITFGLEHVARPIREKAWEDENPAARYATFDIVGTHPDHITYAVDALLDDIELQPSLRWDLIEAIRKSRAHERDPRR